MLVAAGILAYGLHDLQEAGFLPGLHSLAFDVSHIIEPGGWLGTLLKGILNFTPATTWLQAIAWTAYVAIVMPLFLRPVTAPPFISGDLTDLDVLVQAAADVGPAGGWWIRSRPRRSGRCRYRRRRHQDRHRHRVPGLGRHRPRGHHHLQGDQHRHQNQ